jgi:hypothetical protein
MHNKANGRPAFIIVAGVLAFYASLVYASPVSACESSGCARIVLAQNAEPQAQTDATTAAEPAADTEPATNKNSRHTRKSSRPDKADRLASKSSISGKKAHGADKPATQTDAKSDDDKSGVPASVANANAQMAGKAKTVDELVKSLPDKTNLAGNPPAAPVDGTQAATTGQASLPDQAPATDADGQIVASDQLNELDRAAVDDKPSPKILRPVAQTVHAASPGTDDTWGQTSLIGKIFIAFGGFLTLASAARMFIA